MQLWYLVCVLWGRCLSTFILCVVVVRIYSVIIYSKTIDFFLNFFFFKKRNKQCLYPDSLGPRKIRRAVVDLVIGRVSSGVDPSIFCPSRHTVFFSFLLLFFFLWKMTPNYLRSSLNNMASCTLDCIAQCTCVDPGNGSEFPCSVNWLMLNKKNVSNFLFLMFPFALKKKSGHWCVAAADPHSLLGKYFPSGCSLVDFSILAVWTCGPEERETVGGEFRFLSFLRQGLM